MKNNKEWFKLIGLKIISILLHVITFGIPKLIEIIDNKIDEISKNLEVKEQQN